MDFNINVIIEWKEDIFHLSKTVYSTNSILLKESKKSNNLRCHLGHRTVNTFIRWESSAHTWSFGRSNGGTKGGLHTELFQHWLSLIVFHIKRVQKKEAKWNGLILAMPSSIFKEGGDNCGVSTALQRWQHLLSRWNYENSFKVFMGFEMYACDDVLLNRVRKKISWLTTTDMTFDS